jgi:hypothetical protein
MTYPPLPKLLRGPGGRVKVSVEANPVDDAGVPADGVWERATRRILVRADLGKRERWRVFYHEHGHMILDDSGLCNVWDSDRQEVFCDAYATARMSERFG